MKYHCCHGKDLTYTRKKEKQRWAKILKSRTECFMDSFMSAKEGGPTEHVSHVFLSDAKEQANVNAWVSLVHTQMTNLSEFTCLLS